MKAVAVTSEKLTAAEFETRFASQKPYYEFWHGEPVQKSMPTWMHGLLQKILMDLLSQAGYKAASEVKLKIDPDFQLIPDVIATRGRIEGPYPERGLEVVAEILSETDSTSRVLSKCRAYHEWGFAQIYIVDPAARAVLQWQSPRLQEVETFAEMPATEIWDRLNLQLR